MSPKRFAGLVPVVLAAGASSRMGRPKEFLEFQGLTCLEVVLGVCRDAGLAAPILVTRAERTAAVTALLARGGWAEVQLVTNPQPEFGQTSSLRGGLAVLPEKTRGFLIYPVDHPLVTAADVTRLAEAFTQASPPVSIVAPSYAHRRGHPVVVAAERAPALLALPVGGSAREVLAPAVAPTQFVDFDDDRVLLDMDTPEAYERCQRRFRPAAAP